MYDLLSLVKRHIKVFLKDKAAVFFSFLSVIIMLGLYILFLSKQYTQGLDALDDSLRTYLVMSQMMGGILIINTISLSLGMMGNFVTDLSKHTLDSIVISPIKRYKIILSYFISSFLITFVLTLLMFFLTFIYIGITAGYWYSLITVLTAILIILISTALSTALMLFIVSFLKSINAFSTLSGILGTLVGFVSGIYMPLSLLGKGMTYVSSVVPYTHFTIWLKQLLLKEPYQLLEASLSSSPDKESIMASVRSAYGTNTIGIFGIDISLSVIITVLALSSFLFLYLAYKNIANRLENL